MAGCSSGNSRSAGIGIRRTMGRRRLGVEMNFGRDRREIGTLWGVDWQGGGVEARGRGWVEFGGGFGRLDSESEFGRINSVSRTTEG